MSDQQEYHQENIEALLRVWPEETEESILYMGVSMLRTLASWQIDEDGQIILEREPRGWGEWRYFLARQRYRERLTLLPTLLKRRII